MAILDVLTLSFLSILALGYFFYGIDSTNGERIVSFVLAGMNVTTLLLYISYLPSVPCVAAPIIFLLSASQLVGFLLLSQELHVTKHNTQVIKKIIEGE